jgi:hypothetical protein
LAATSPTRRWGRTAASSARRWSMATELG